MLRSAHLRIARATNHLAEVTSFYRDGLGFEVLFSFEAHDGFDGVMLGHHGAGYHLEFTHRCAEHVAGAPTRENLLVFYLPDRNEWETVVARMKGQGHQPVPAENPYWDRAGLTFEDPDAYRVVLQNAAWPG